MTKMIATPSRTKEILDRYSLRAKKNFGQNFLIEPGIVEKIAQNAIIEHPCVVMEIGPGIGALTQALATYADKVVSFEIDSRLIDVLNTELSEYDNIEIRLQDFLELDLKQEVDNYKKEGYHVYIAANLPYYITTPLLFKIFEAQADIEAITVMMQKEVGDRFSASVNTKDYNALSIISQYRCEIRNVMKVPKSVFNPKPNVDSCVLQFKFKTNTDIQDEEAFFLMVKACFKQRRKTILNNYGEYLNDKSKAKSILGLANIAENARGESLTLETFKKLYEVQTNENILLR
ncbi:MAG: 16S rRNA (adenine(1518)-N(6)/adenine(1519)-N(6))-dimethyltransferase RsmA [Erysipelotrichaceae bacterium]